MSSDDVGTARKHPGWLIRVAQQIHELAPFALLGPLFREAVQSWLRDYRKKRGGSVPELDDDAAPELPLPLPGRELTRDEQYAVLAAIHHCVFPECPVYSDADPSEPSDWKQWAQDTREYLPYWRLLNAVDGLGDDDRVRIESFLETARREIGLPEPPSGAVPPDLIAKAVAKQRYHASDSTLLRHERDGTLKAYRPPGAKQNTGKLYSDAALSRLFPRR